MAVQTRKMNKSFTLVDRELKLKTSLPGLVQRGGAPVVEKRALDKPEEAPKPAMATVEEEKPKRVLKGTKPRKLL
jgi:hypothetical protein